MTLRHIVSWRMTGATNEERSQAADEAIEALAPLAESVPSVRALRVHRNELHEGDNYDLMLVADFDDAAGLAEYATHPTHLPVVALMKQLTAQRAAIDFTI